MKWDDLDYIQKGSLAKIYLNEGISSIDDMKSHYDSLPENLTESPPTKDNPFKRDNLFKRYTLVDKAKERLGNERNIQQEAAVQDNDIVYKTKPLKPVTVTADHPLWDYPDYASQRNNPNIQAHRDALYKVRRGHDEAGKKYLQAVGQTASALSYLTGLGEEAMIVNAGLKGLTKALGKEVTEHVPAYVMQMTDVVNDLQDPDVISVSLDSPGRILSKVDDAIPLGKFSFLKYLDNWIPPAGAAYDYYGALKTVNSE